MSQAKKSSPRQSSLQKELLAFKADLFLFIQDQSRLTTDLLQQEIKASEVRLRQEIQAVKFELREEIKASEARISDSVADILETSVLPQLEDHEGRIFRIESSPSSPPPKASYCEN